jgi:hypothetical protein
MSPSVSSCAPPIPSSVTSITIRVSSLENRTVASVAWLCLAIFVSDSAMTKYAVVSTECDKRSVTSFCTSTGIGDLAARADSEASRPRSVRNVECIPRTKSRNSTIACFASLCAGVMSSTVSGSVSSISKDLDLVSARRHLEKFPHGRDRGTYEITAGRKRRNVPPSGYSMSSTTRARKPLFLRALALSTRVALRRDIPFRTERDVEWSGLPRDSRAW